MKLHKKLLYLASPYHLHFPGLEYHRREPGAGQERLAELGQGVAEGHQVLEAAGSAGTAAAKSSTKLAGVLVGAAPSIQTEPVAAPGHAGPVAAAVAAAGCEH